MKKVSKSKPKAAEITLDYGVLNSIVDRAYYMALEMIDIANNRPVTEKGEPKVGGHPTACASSKHILGAIHLVLREPEDYFACKPHVSPMDHAYNFMLRNFRNADDSAMDVETSKLAMRHLRHFSRTGEPVFQSYHAESDPDSHRYFPSGSVGIPPVNALYMSLAYQYAKSHNIELDEEPTFWCLMGDSEFREGSLMEAMPDAGDRVLNNLVWIVDYNRQNLDGTRVFNEAAFGGSDAERIVRIANANGWNGVLLKHGMKREKMFSMPGGEEFRRVLDEACTDFELQALISANDPKRTREHLASKSKKLSTWFGKFKDAQIHEAFMNLGGHDMESLVRTFTEAKKSNKPTLVVAYTIKGHSLQSQAKSGNHSAMPEADEIEAMAKRLGASRQDPFNSFSESSPEGKYLNARQAVLVPGINQLRQTVAERKTTWREKMKEVEWPADFDITAIKFNPVAHTQWMWGQIAAKLDRLGRDQSTSIQNETERNWQKVASHFLTMAPDVGSSTNTSPNMNTKIFGDIQQEDFELEFGTKDAKAPDVVPRASERSGHIRFEIAEGNCMSAAGSFGKFGYFVGVPFYPAMTIYDFFIKRAHDQFYYNWYWHSSFATLGTPSGITLAPEGAQHSWKSDFQIPNGITWEPCFTKELEWILADTLKRHFTFENFEREGALIRCMTKGLVQKDLLDRLKRQGKFAGMEDSAILETTRLHTLEGAYALVDYRGQDGYVPGDNVVHIFAMGALVAEALKASDALLEQGIFANVFVVTSSDLLLGNFADNNKYHHLRETLGLNGDLYLNPERGSEIRTKADWFYARGSRVPVLSVHDGEPGLLDNIGSALGTRQKALAVRKISKSGTTWDIFHYHHVDQEGIVAAASELLKETAEERLVFSKEVWSEAAAGETSEEDSDDGLSSSSPLH